MKGMRRMTEHEGPHLLTNVTVHSTAEPYAEAMIVEDGLVSWVGSEETAGRLRDERFLIEDAEAALATPAFFGWLRRHAQSSAKDLIDALNQAAQRGIGTVRVVFTGFSPDDLKNTAALLQAVEEHPLSVHPVLELDALQCGDSTSGERLTEAAAQLEKQYSGPPLAIGLPAEVWDGDAAAETIGPFAAAAAQAAQQLVLCLPQATEPSVVVETVLTVRRGLLDLGSSTPPADRPTVLYGFDAADLHVWESLIGAGVHVVLIGEGHLALALRAGVPTSVAPAEGHEPWSVVSAYVHREEDPVSVRAAFNAQVRGAHRMVSGLPAGHLNPGSAATYALWEVDSLAVQTPDSRTAAWSTDARARTPLLPYLDGETLPRHLRTVVNGIGVSAAASASTTEAPERLS